MMAQIENIPTARAHDFERRFWPQQWVAFASNRFDQCGFAAAIGAENGDVFPRIDTEVQAVERETSAAFDVDVFEFE